jgi:hypothetical protein
MSGSPSTVEANRLYWETETPVADIAARFDLSRRALYEAVQPMPAHADCPECGVALCFENRLARRTRKATCPECGARIDVGSTTARPDPVIAQAVRVEGRSASARERYNDDRSNERRARAVLLSGAALAGVALGGVAAWLASRRD